MLTCDTLQSLKDLQTILADPTSDSELLDLARTDIESTHAALPSLTNTLQKSLIPPHPFANFPCYIEVHPGAGGSEASIFAHELLEMYMAFCSRLGWQYSLASYTPDDSTPGGSQGVVEAILEIHHPASYGTLRTESGVHRVQRVPATEKKGRTHTSAVSVLVLPLLPETGTEELNYDDPNSDYYVSAADVRSETMRARGAGGQHVNKTDSAVRLTHMPTGIVVAMQESRSQHKNREKAWTVLRSKIAALKREKREEEMIALRRNAMGGVARTGREDKIRTYNFSQRRVSDHRCGWDTSDLDGVLTGGDNLEVCMSHVRAWMDEEDVKGLLAEEEMKRREEEKKNK